MSKLNDLTYGSDIVRAASHACLELQRLLEEENAALEARDIAQVEQLTGLKRQLSRRLEVLLSSVSQHADSLRDDPTTSVALEELKNHVEELDEVARRNFTLLDANHQATQNFLTIVRRALTPMQASTYGSQGSMSEDESKKTSLVVKSV